jgi:hypothetical protein
MDQAGCRIASQVFRNGSGNTVKKMNGYPVCQARMGNAPVHKLLFNPVFF